MFRRALQSRQNSGRIIALAVAGLFVLVLGSGLAAITVVPSAGAHAADWLRGIVGDQAVAQLETLVFQLQDDIHQAAYRLGASRPASPWDSAPVVEAPEVEAPTDSTPPEPDGTSPTLSPAVGPTAAVPQSATPSTANASQPATLAAPTAQPAWALPALNPIGTLPGEGNWSIYMKDSAGQVVAYRTFLQPDNQRPYAVAAIVAFDLGATRLHFVLGTLEPASDVALARPGTIPPGDLQAGNLLATFNGGFKARHGHFGVMVNGLTVIPARNGLGTVAMYDDGHITIGRWDASALASPHVVAWRQNGPLVIQNGQINPHTADTSALDWGYTVPGRTAIWRSGIGISADGRTLYYIAGPSLTLPALAVAMQAAGMDQAIQLDINNYWVHFDALQGPRRQATPLLDKMNYGVGRYLAPYSRDFFYVTANGG